MLENPDLDQYVDERVYDREKLVGTIVDVDRDAGEFFLEPSGELPKNRFESLGWATAAEYDENWEDLDYDLWRDDDEDLPLDYDEWPFTLPAARLDEREGDEGLQVVAAE